MQMEEQDQQEKKEESLMESVMNKDLTGSSSSSSSSSSGKKCDANTPTKRRKRVEIHPVLLDAAVPNVPDSLNTVSQELTCKKHSLHKLLSISHTL